MTTPRSPRALLLALLAGLSALATTGRSADRIRLLFDDYYQKPRDEARYDQGVARGGSELRNQSNFYLPTATAIPNGTFAFSEIISDRFAVETVRAPLSAELLANAGGYLLFCPVKASQGGRAEIGEREAGLLRDFVARGGLLLVVANSVTDEAKNPVDFAGLNRVARRFGVEFLFRQTETLSIPIPADHPHFDGVRDVIYGNGTILAQVGKEADTEVLLESQNPAVPGPVAILARLGRGRALFFGDAGSFGNAHVVRDDVSQREALRQLVATLLPDGPAPAYGWAAGQKLRVKVREERILSGYPEFMRIFDAAHPSGTKSYASGMRQVDLEAGGAHNLHSANHDFVSVVTPLETELTLEVGGAADRGFTAALRWPDASLTGRLLGNGRWIDTQPASGERALDWQHALLNDLLCAPLSRVARPGESWRAPGFVALPQLQLGRPGTPVSADSNVQFRGEEDLRGEPCFVFVRSTLLDGHGWTPQQLIDPAFANLFNERDAKLLGGGLVARTTYWISRRTRLPVRTELAASASIWWNDARFPSKYIGSHDSKTYEQWSSVVFVATWGRTLTADFSPVDSPK